MSKQETKIAQVKLGETVPQPVKEETVQVSRKDLERMMKTIEDLSKGQETLFKAADKSRLARINEQAGPSLVKTVKISMWRGNMKYVIGWKMTKNISEILPGSNRWHEDQQTMLVFEDGTTLEVSLLEFFRNMNKDVAEVISTEQKNVDGKSSLEYKVQFPTGQVIVINSIFVN